MEATVREFTKIQAAAELIWDLSESAENAGTEGAAPDLRGYLGGIRTAVSMILDELHCIRLREAERMDEWGEGELEEDLDDLERKILTNFRKARKLKRESEITKDGLTVLLGAKAMGPMKKEAEPGRLPDVPDWRDNANLSDGSDERGSRKSGTRSPEKRGSRKSGTRSAGKDGAAAFAEDDRLTRIRLTVAAHQGDGLAEIIEAILADGTDLKTLASILGVNKARISEAKHGHARPGFVARFAEVLGSDGGAANNGADGAYEANGQERGRRGMANCRGKRGAK